MGVYRSGRQELKAARGALEVAKELEPSAESALGPLSVLDRALLGVVLFAGAEELEQIVRAPQSALGPASALERLDVAQAGAPTVEGRALTGESELDFLIPKPCNPP